VRGIDVLASLRLDDVVRAGGVNRSEVCSQYRRLVAWSVYSIAKPNRPGNLAKRCTLAAPSRNLPKSRFELVVSSDQIEDYLIRNGCRTREGKRLRLRQRATRVCELGDSSCTTRRRSTPANVLTVTYGATLVAMARMIAWSLRSTASPKAQSRKNSRTLGTRAANWAV
jgi:hypothetical protein